TMRRLTRFARCSPRVELRRGAVGGAAGGVGGLALLARLRLRTIGGALGLARLALQVADARAKVAAAALLCLLLATIGHGRLLRGRRPGRTLHARERVEAARLELAVEAAGLQGLANGLVDRTGGKRRRDPFERR